LSNGFGGLDGASDVSFLVLNEPGIAVYGNSFFLNGQEDLSPRSEQPVSGVEECATAEGEKLAGEEDHPVEGAACFERGRRLGLGANGPAHVGEQADPLSECCGHIRDFLSCLLEAGAEDVGGA